MVQGGLSVSFNHLKSLKNFFFLNFSPNLYQAKSGDISFSGWEECRVQKSKLLIWNDLSKHILVLEFWKSDEILSIHKQGSNLLQCILLRIILNLGDFLFWWEHFLVQKRKNNLKKKFAPSQIWCHLIFGSGRGKQLYKGTNAQTPQ